MGAGDGPMVRASLVGAAARRRRRARRELTIPAGIERTEVRRSGRVIASKNPHAPRRR